MDQTILDIIIRAKDEVSKVVKDASKNMSGLGKASKGIQGALSSTAGLIGEAGVGAALVSAAKASMSFNSQMLMIQTQAGASGQEVKSMSKFILGLGGKVTQTPQELAQALFHVESAGIHGANAQKLLYTASQLATVGGSDLTDTTNALIATMNSGITGFHGMSGAAGIMNSIVGNGNMTMSDMVGIIKTGVLSTAHAFGASMQDTGAVIDTLANGGLNLGRVGSTVNRMYTILGASTKAQTATFAALGISTQSINAALTKTGVSTTDLANDIRSGGLTKAVLDLKTHMDKMGLTASQQAAVISKAFGARAGPAMDILLNNTDKLQANFKNVTNGANTFQSAAQKASSDSQANWEKFKGELQTLRIEVGDKLVPIFDSFLKKVMKLINYLSTHKEVAKAIGIAFASIGAALLGIVGISKLVNGINDISKAVKGVNKALKLTKMAKSVFKTGWGVAKVIAGFVKTAAGAVVSAASTAASWVAGAAVSAASWLVANAVMTAGIILVVAIVVAAVYEIVKHWKSVKEFFKKLWKDIKDFVRQHWKLILDIILGPIAIIITNWGVISRFFTKLWSDIVTGVAAFIKGVIKFFTDLPGQVLNELKSIGTWLLKAGGDLIGGLIKGITDAGKLLWQGLTTTFNAIGTFVRGIGSWLWNAGGQLISGLVNGIIAAAKWLWNGLTNTFSAIGNFVKGIGTWLYDAGKSLIHGFINGIKSAVGDAKKAVSDVLNAVKNFFPHSPAKEGPFSGSGWTLYSGQATIKGFAQGLTSQTGAARSAITGVMSQVSGSAKASLTGTANSSPSTVQPQSSASGAQASGGNTVNNFTVNIGMYAGTQTEKQKIATELWQAMMQVARVHNAAGNMPAIGVRPI